MFQITGFFFESREGTYFASQRSSKEGDETMSNITRGLKEKGQSAVHTDLDHLAGTWSKEDTAEFAGVVAEFGRVDEEMWK